MKIEMKKTLETHEQIVGNSWSTWEMVATGFSCVIIVMYDTIVDTILCITPMIFVKFKKWIHGID